MNKVLIHKEIWYILNSIILTSSINWNHKKKILKQGFRKANSNLTIF